MDLRMSADMSTPMSDPRNTLTRLSRRALMKRASSAPQPEAMEPWARIKIGVCAMDKKAQSKPMKEIIARIMSFNEFEIVSFGDQMITEQPVEKWPACDCLLSWHSDGFPLKKAQAYVSLRRPFCVNDLQQQEVLLDRRKVYKTLTDNSIPVPTHIIVSRDELAEGLTDPPGFVEDHDYVEMNGVRISKPFVEKPVSGEDHNIYIYYPYSMGGGVKRLFRKVDDKSSMYDPNHSGAVRRDGSYIYEEFLPTGGTDVKVYTVGPRYAHAEARKSPVVDGKVQRSADGKEVRFPVLLSPQEKEIARMVCLAFGQKVCGFDLLRSERGKSFVCDVNGWSFVKNSKKYYDDAAGILRSVILNALAPHRLTTMPMLNTGPIFSAREEDEGVDVVGSMKAVMSLEDMSGLDDLDYDDEEGLEEGNPQEELRCVLAVVRHGDRTPKQKMKMKVSQPSILALFDKYKDSKGKQAKLKSPNQLQEFLDITRDLLKSLTDREPPAEGEAPQLDKDEVAELREKLQIVRTVLEAGGHFSGVNRKVQLKPIRWAVPAEDSAAAPAPAAPAPAPAAGGVASGPGSGGPAGAPPAPLMSLPPLAPLAAASSGGGAAPAAEGGSAGGAAAAGSGRVEELLLVLKWGGVLTHAGRQQAENLGMYFRASMYPRYGPAGGGLLRLHSTYRHDLKIYSSDEGRVQTSAAAFTKGLLDLEGNSLTPILVSLVNKDASMLEAFGKGASDDLKQAKEVLYQQLTWDPDKSTALCSPLSTAVTGSQVLPSPPASPMHQPAPQHGLLSKTSTFGHDNENGSSGNIAAAASRASNAATVLLQHSPHVLLQPVSSWGSLKDSKTGDMSRRDSGSGANGGAAAADKEGAGEGCSEQGPPGPHIRNMPEKPVTVLHVMVEQLKELVDALRTMVVDETKKKGGPSPVASPSPMPPPSPPLTTASSGGLQHANSPPATPPSSSPAPPAAPPSTSAPNNNKAYSSLSQAPEEWELEGDKPCSGEKLLLMYDRWRKLLKSVYNEKKGQFDISKIPDIYDSAKYDAIHNRHLGLTGLQDLYFTAKQLADVVIPNEYGVTPPNKLSVGSKICRELVGKLLADMANMREESIVTAGSWDQDGAGTAVDRTSAYSDSMFTEFGRMALEDENMRTKKGTLAVQHSPSGHADLKAQGDEEPHGDGDHEAETLHRLCPTYASDINSPLRHVRTRIYFTSESHIHSLVNVLRFAHLRPGYQGAPVVNPDCENLLENTPEFDYLTHIVFRMYENKGVPVDSRERFRVEVSLSPGAAYNPLVVVPPKGDHTLPVVPRVHLNLGTAETLGELEELLMPHATPRKVSPSIYALQVALKAPSNPMSRMASGGQSSANLVTAAAGANASLTSLLANKAAAVAAGQPL